ncbi:MAG: CBS domain-containing protein [Cellvibrionaceae bacterium]
MKVREFMTENPQCCSPDASLREAAQYMADCDCGEIPVLDSQKRPIGVITDRDIACRAVAKGKAPETTKVSDIMTSPAITIGPEQTLEDCCKLMDDNQIRRVPVVDDSGACCGIVAQADVVKAANESDAAHLVEDISRPNSAASRASH